jgi:hypothetical protein
MPRAFAMLHLRKPAGTPQFPQRHFLGQQLCDAGLHLLAALRTQFSDLVVDIYRHVRPNEAPAPLTALGGLPVEIVSYK